MSSAVPEPKSPAGDHPLLQRLRTQYGYPFLDDASLAGFLAQPGEAVLFFVEEPERYRETLDVAVILPELAVASGKPFRVGVLLPEAARPLAPRYGLRRWPALVFLRGGEYLGAIEGLLDWAEFRTETARLLDAPASRPPTIGVSVTATRA
jgi:hydrogenase-1 operon protein HyaE